MALSAVYQAQAIPAYDADVITLYTAQIYAPGQIVSINGLAGYVEKLFPCPDGSGSNSVSIRVRRANANVISASATLFTAGNAAYWNPTSNLAVTTLASAGTGGFFLGQVRFAKTSGQLFVNVDFNVGTSAPETT
jgi:hypothetical protein